MLGIELYHENQIYRQYLQQQQLLQQIYILHQSQPIFIPPRASIIDMACSYPQSNYNSFRSRLVSGHDSARTEIPDISKFQNPQPVTSLALPLGKMNTYLRWSCYKSYRR